MGNVLDKFDETPERRWFEHWSIVYIPTGLFIVGLIFRLQHWPGATMIMSIGLILMMARSLIFFLSKKRIFGEWAYFLGRMVLYITLIGSFIFRYMPSNYLPIGLFIFGLGLIVYLLTRKKKTEEPIEKIEDDY